jgi:hypothetical protein
MLDSLGQDLRFAFRYLTGRPLVAIIAVVTLAVGIGGTTAIFKRRGRSPDPRAAVP